MELLLSGMAINKTGKYCTLVALHDQKTQRIRENLPRKIAPGHLGNGGQVLKVSQLEGYCMQFK
jgi:hypothetical protein